MQRKGTDGARVSSRPCHNTNVAGNSTGRANRHKQEALKSLKLSPLFPSKADTRRAIPSLFCFRREYFIPSFFLLSLSSKMSILPAQWYRVRECLSFYILLPHTSSCMHLSLLSEAYIDIKRGEKKCCVRRKGFSCQCFFANKNIW